MAAKVRWRDDAWWVATHHRGRRKMQRVGPTKADRRKAEKLADRINAALALGHYEPDKPSAEPLPFDGYVRGWLTTYAPTFKPSYEQTARVQIERHLVPFFGSKDLTSITEDDLLGYIARKLDQKLSRSTIQNGLSIVRRILNIAQRRGQVSRNPASRIGELLKRVDRRLATETVQVDSWTRPEMTGGGTATERCDQ